MKVMHSDWAATGSESCNLRRISDSLIIRMIEHQSSDEFLKREAFHDVARQCGDRLISTTD